MNIAYDNEHHLRSFARGIQSAGRVAGLVYPVVGPRSVVDVGCGLGYWLRAFLDAGAGEVLGLDGDYLDRSRMAIPAEAFRVMDLNRPEAINRSFDLALSIEVAEHLRPESGPTFVAFLCDLSPCVLFSAAIPGQPGHNHINARWPGYWKALFQERGYVGFDFLRPAIWHDESLMLCHRQNLLFFAREDVAPRFDALNLPRTNCLTLVDEGVLEAQFTLRATLDRLVDHLKRRLRPGRR